jgi:5'-nucleotidase (lipoprotein e(P4) family)
MASPYSRFVTSVLPALLFFSPCCSVHAQSSCPPSHERLHAVLWMQRSAEYNANLTQAFRLATVNLTEAINDPARWPEAVTPKAPAASRPPAIIVDVDETLLSNTPEEATFIAASKRKYDLSIWDAWEARANATPLPGALAFVQFAAAKSVAVFFVTNRNNEAKLRENLAAARFPVAASPDVVLLPGECSTGDKGADKECRRQDVASKYRILLLVGDDLGDFMSVGGLSADERIRRSASEGARWGREWIALPNPAYGSWERAFYDWKADDGDVILFKKLIALEGPQ